jgi:fatty acid elongase 3
MATASPVALFDQLPVPTLDRPFGIHLWPIFNKAFEYVVGYPADDFKFQPGVTPMSTLKETSIFIVIYYTVIFGGRELMRNREPFKLRTLFLIHNFYLTAISAILLALFIEQILPTVVRHGIFHAICAAEGGWTQPLVVLYYLNYLTKYLELLDTCFLFLKKKPLTFLHCYHHGATALLCYTQLIGSTSVSWVVISLNLMVHVVMYWYYFQSARGVKIWWKEWITRLQIIQFVIDLGFVYFASWTYFTSTYWPWLPNVGRCAGEEFAAFSGIAILSSYLFLFISFYFATYKKDGKRPSGRKAVRRMSQAPLPDPIHGTIANANANGYANGNDAKATGVKTNGTATRSRRA